MKHSYMSKVARWLDGAWFSNKPVSQLSPGDHALPKCHETPPKHTSESWDGVKLPYMVALPETKPKAIMLIVPGTDCVTGDFSSLTIALVAQGYAVYGCENRTFSYGPEPESKKGNPRDWHPWVKDLQGFSRFVKTLHPGLPIFWQGHSFGGVQILQTAAECTGEDVPDGLVVHSPGFGLMFKKATFLRGLSYGIISWLRLPWLRLMDTCDMPLSTDPEWDCRWQHSEDRLPHGFKVRYLINAANMGIAARNSSPKLTMPVLALWGGKDRMGLGGNDKLRAEYDHYMRHELASGHATQFYCGDGGHLLTEGATKQAALDEIIRWLAAHVS